MIAEPKWINCGPAPNYPKTGGLAHFLSFVFNPGQSATVQGKVPETSALHKPNARAQLPQWLRKSTLISAMNDLAAGEIFLFYFLYFFFNE